MNDCEKGFYLSNTKQNTLNAGSQTRAINSPDFSSRFVYESEFKAIAENNALHDPLFMKLVGRCAAAVALVLRCIGVQPPEAYPQTLSIEHVITLRIF